MEGDFSDLIGIYIVYQFKGFVKSNRTTKCSADHTSVRYFSQIMNVTNVSVTCSVPLGLPNVELNLIIC